MLFIEVTVCLTLLRIIQMIRFVRLGSHVAVIIFKVEAGVRLGYTSCTSQQCSWNKTHKVNLYHNCKNISLHF